MCRMLCPILQHFIRNLMVNRPLCVTTCNSRYAFDATHSNTSITTIIVAHMLCYMQYIAILHHTIVSRIGVHSECKLRPRFRSFQKYVPAPPVAILIFISRVFLGKLIRPTCLLLVCFTCNHEGFNPACCCASSLCC